MTIREQLERLNETDIWSLLLFVLFKLKDIPEYSAISELSYVLDRKNMLKFCEYFGGSTIKVPTIEELEQLVYALLMYQYIDIEGIESEEAFEKIAEKQINLRSIKNYYKKLKEVLKDYKITSRARNDI